MAVIEVNPQRTDLDSVRDRLVGFLHVVDPTIEGYEAHMVEYLQAFHARYVEDDPTQQAVFFNLYAADVVKQEVEGIVGYSIECPQDVTARLHGYVQDETGETLRNTGYSAYPRALTMTLLDLIDTYK